MNEGNVLWLMKEKDTSCIIFIIYVGQFIYCTSARQNDTGGPI